MVTPSGGQEAWVARYNGTANDYDEAHAIALDSAGNVFVTGSSVGSDTDADYVTIKYDTSGQEQWVARYNGPANSGDVATAIAVDDSGNVYVTGRSVGTTYLEIDYATVKYNSAGQQQWVARYNGPSNGDNEATAIAVDSSGNVYVTGESQGSGGNYDYATIKYNSSGQEQWVGRYNGPANGDDYAAAIALDASSNVYVTGGSAGSGTGDDYVTIKYNSAGQQQWVARYNGLGNGGGHANAIAIDHSGYIYVTGFSPNSGNEVDCATIKYDSGGREHWVARYSAPAHILDYADAIAVDSSGNVSVTGTSFASVDNADYVTIKYNSTGQEQWVARYDAGGTPFRDYATAIAVDTLGNIYVTGTSEVSGTDFDYATIKYDSLGQQQWVARYNGPGGGFDQANAIAIDGSGNVYVTGRSYGSGTGLSDYATIKYVQGATPTPTPTPRVTPRSRPTPAPRP
jgi:uncharacterized delta-60 repeat protein